MSSRDSKRRTREVEMRLTPKQKVILWQKKLPPFEGGKGYNQWILDQCVKSGLDPRSQLKNEVEFDIRRAMVHERPGAIEQAVTQGRQQVHFLTDLFERVNAYALHERIALEREVAELLLVLESSLHRARLLFPLHRLLRFRDTRIPYPLDKPTAAAVGAAEANCVMSLLLLDATHISWWVGEHFVRQGKREIPYEVRNRVADYSKSGHPEQDEELKKLATPLFHDVEALRDFLAGKDCQHGVADVRDSEWELAKECMFDALSGLVERGTVEASSVVVLPTVPMISLRVAPLIDDTWIDEFVVARAEEGALLSENGFEAVPYEEHRLAWHRIVSRSGDEADAEQVRAIRQAARENLARFKGRRKEIEARPYIHFGDFSSWKGRKLRGDLNSEDRRKKGIVVRSWNRMIEEQGGEGEAELAGIKVKKIVVGHSFVTFDDPAIAAEKQAARKQVCVETRDWAEGGSPGTGIGLLRAILWERLSEEFFPFDSYRQAALFAAQRKLAEAVQRRRLKMTEVVERVNERYFGGEMVPWRYAVPGTAALSGFDDVKRSHDEIVAECIRLTGAEGVPQPEPLALEDVIRQAIEPQVEEDISRLVANAEADALIARGKYEEARKILEPYLMETTGPIA
jgi:hypothetical protein